jgi:hypothetical protein
MTDECPENNNNNRKKKEKKVKAWCGDCYQSFENSPFTKICKEHLTKGNCSLVECKKMKSNLICIRKFPNINSENRHTYCVTNDQVKNWEEQFKLQNCLGVKRSSDIDYEMCKLNSVNIDDKHNKNLLKLEMGVQTGDDLDNKNEMFNFDILNSGMNNKNYECSLINEINNLNFIEEKFCIDDNLIDEFNNIVFNNNTHLEVLKKESCKEPEGKICKILENENIDEIFEKVHDNTSIPKSILNKLKSFFKKKGIFNSKILRLFKKKNNNLNFLVDEFKMQCTQIEGVVLFLENAL